jgi:DNA-binding SARP family transcriptional activator
MSLELRVVGRAQLRLLGGFECCDAAGAPQAFPTRKVRALLAYLAVTAGQAHRRDQLAGLLWGDRAEAQARADLRKSLSRLRASLPEEAKACLAADPGRVGLHPDVLEVDALRFARCAADGTPETLEHAAALYRGPFLDGLDADSEEEFESWLSAERRRLEETLREVLRQLLDHYAVTGAVDRAIQVALRFLALDPLQESVHRTLIRLYLYQDRVGSALDQYRRCRELLAAELGVKPAPETERLRAELLQLVPVDGQRPPLRSATTCPSARRCFRRPPPTGCAGVPR